MRDNRALTPKLDRQVVERTVAVAWMVCDTVDEELRLADGVAVKVDPWVPVTEPVCVSVSEREGVLDKVQLPLRDHDRVWDRVWVVECVCVTVGIHVGST